MIGLATRGNARRATVDHRSAETDNPQKELGTRMEPLGRAQRDRTGRRRQRADPPSARHMLERWGFRGGPS